LIDAFLADIRFALRWFVKSPGFTIVAVVSLAIGIGFNTALFTVVDAVLFRPLPVVEPDRLVDVFTSVPGQTAAQRFGTSSYPDYSDLKSHNAVFDDMIAYSPMFAALSMGERSRLVLGEIVSGNYFRVLGVNATVGRTIAPPDDEPGASRVAMVSYRFWKNELGGAVDVAGRTIKLRGTTFTIVGVAPRWFTGMEPLLAPDLWVAMPSSEAVPVGMRDVVPSPTGTSRLDRRGERWLFLKGRLKPGVTFDQAQANLSVVMAQIAAANPVTNKDRQVTTRPTRDVRIHPAVDAVVVPYAAGLAIVVGLVLLIACANVASMLLARASGRQREIAVRLAIGASRSRLVRQLVTESLVLSAIGAAAGALVAWSLMRTVEAVSLPIAVPLAFGLRVDVRALLFTIGATVAAGLLAGVLPAVRASKPDLVADLRGEATVATTGTRRWALRDVLVSGQMALTALLLIVAALLTRSLIAAEQANVGFEVERLASITLDPSMFGYNEERTRQFWESAMARVRALPGVQSAALVTRLPFAVNVSRWDIYVPGHHHPGDQLDIVDETAVTPEYFATIGVPILQGRNFTEADRPDTPRVAIINETMARRYWPNESAVGKTIRVRSSDGPAFEIVGVSRDHKVLTVDETPTPFLHVSRIQRPNSYSSLIARTRGDAPALLRAMRRELLALEPNAVVLDSRTMASQMESTLFPVRASAWIVGIVGLTAMVLAAVGLYGIIAYSVTRRTREIGIRIALGAEPRSVLALVMRQGLFVAAVGLAIGAALAAVSARAFARVLYGVGIADPVSWLGAGAVLLAVSAVANAIPAIRAARIAPQDALRTE
jgi:predicted permease